MRKITLFAMLLVGILAGRAENAFVGTYNGDIDLEHMQGDPVTMKDQTVTISETADGKVNVKFPSFTLMMGLETGEITIEDVTVVDNEDGTFELSKEVFTLTAGIIKCEYCYFYCDIDEEGEASMMVEVKQNPQIAITTAYFYSSSTADGETSIDIVSPIAACYGGELNQKHLVPAIPETTESDKLLTIEKSTDSTAIVTFPSVAVLGQTITGDFTIEDVDVDTLGNGFYTLIKDTFSISVGGAGSMTTSYNFCSMSGTINTNDSVVTMTVKVIQNPQMGALNTSTFTGKAYDSSTFIWGEATWNTENNVVYEGIEKFEEAGLTLSYPNPTGFALGFLNVILVEYDVYVDDDETPIKTHSTAQGSSNVLIDYAFVEGHDYKIVTTKAQLAQANLATRTTDTLSTSLDSYEISFTINGPEIVDTIEVENWMSLAITDQEYIKTVSTVDVTKITSALGINNINEAVMHPIRPNGSYCDHMDYFDWWRDADGDFTTYNGGWNSIFGGNAKPAVYSIKVNEAADSVTYYFFDAWREYVPTEDETVGGGTITTRATVVWDWDNGDGSTTKYNRTYRVEEGTDYQSSVMYVANQKAVVLRATLHFVSEEEWHEKTAIEEPSKVATEAVEYYSIAGVRQPGLQKGINIVRYTDGTTRKVMVK